MVDLLHKTLGPYQIMAVIGQGGMGTVYKALQPSLNRYVAIKVLPAYLAQDEEFVQRFRREANIVASLQHPNILTIYDIGQDGGLYYIVMQLLEGCTLAQLIEQESPCHSPASRGLSPRLPRLWTMPTTMPSSTATSSRPIFSSGRTTMQRSWISGSSKL
jgi:serine/threonine protein kinase